MHGLGNDFIIFDNIKNSIIHDSKFINKISNRRRGIAEEGKVNGFCKFPTNPQQVQQKHTSSQLLEARV